MFLDEEVSHFLAHSWPTETSHSDNDRVEANKHIQRQGYAQNQIEIVSNIVASFTISDLLYITAVHSIYVIHWRQLLVCVRP